MSARHTEVIEFKSVGSTLEELTDNNQIELNPKIRQLIFILLSIVYCISSCDGGIIPQQNKNIQ